MLNELLPFGSRTCTARRSGSLMMTRCIENTSQVGGWLCDFSAWAGASKSSTALREGTSIHQGATVCGATSPPRTEVDCELEASDSRVRVNFDDFLYFALA